MADKVGECVDVERVPVTQEHLVEMIVGGADGSTKTMLERALYDSIIRMVIGIANGYAVNSVDDADDLVQECMKRIMTNLHKYDCDKAKFSTWAHRVSRSVCDRKYLTSAKIKKTFVRMSETWDAPERERVTSSLACGEVVEVIKELFEKYPKKAHILQAMFGNPYADDYIMPDSIDVSDAARKANVNYGQTHAFYSRKVRPFFRQKFKREDFHARA